MIREKLFKGEIAGVDFYFKELTQGGGRKTIIHDFINSDKVTGEDMGRMPRSFGMSIYIAGIGKTKEAIADSYFERKSAMIETLETYGTIEMVHPTRGVIKVMQSSRYSMVESVGSLNKLTISASFIEVDNDLDSRNPSDFAKVAPDTRTFELSSGGITSATEDENQNDSDPFNATDESNLRNNVFERSGWSVNDSLEKFGIKADYFKSAQSILENVESVQEVLNKTMQAISGTGDYSDIFRAIEGLSFLNTGSDLFNIGRQIGDVFVAVENTVSSVTEKYYFFKVVFDYNDDFEDKQPLTATSLPNNQTRDNEVFFRDYMQTLGTGYGCNALADYDYKDEDELNRIAKEIIDQLDKMLAYQACNTEQYNLLQRQKVVMLEQIDKSRLTVRSIITVTVKNTSLTKVCYDYYGSLELLDTIQDLNGFTNPSNLSGEIKILSGGTT